MALTWSPSFDWDKEGWRVDAACRCSDANVFFPVGTTGVAIGLIEAAKAVCKTCPVQAECLQFAFETNQEAGIWGGKDEEERRRLRRIWRAGRRPGSREASA